MPEPTGTDTTVSNEGQETTEQNTDTNEDVKVISNSEAKKLPWVQEMAASLKALQAEKAERESAAEKAKHEADLERAKAAKDYDEALRLEKEAAEKEISTLRSEALSAKMRAELLSQGATLTDGLLKVAVAEYDPEKFDSLEAYTTSLKENEAYSPFFTGSTQSREVKGDLPSATASGGKPNWDQVKAWENSNDRAERAKARKELGDYHRVHGKYPY